MKQYNTTSKMFGYKIGIHNDNIYVAVPEKYFRNGETVEVTSFEEKRVYSINDKAAETTFPDRFGKGMTYKLYYFLWKAY